MKRILSVAILVALPYLLSAQTLIGSWNFNGNANDGSGHGLNGTVYGATLTAGQGGVANTAYQFNGSSSHIDIPYDTLLNLTTWTIQVLVRIDSFNPASCQQENFVIRGTFMTGDYMGVSINDNTHDGSCSTYSPNYTEFVPDVAGVGTGAGLRDANYLQLNTWYCHTVTYDGSVVRMYTNGALIDSLIWSNQYNFSNSNTVQPQLILGYYPGGGLTFPYWFNGALDNLTIWSGALSSTAVASASCNFNPNVITITQPFTDTAKCAGAALNLHYTVTGTFNSANTFTAQLSNASGSFATPVNIGSLTSTAAGTINCTIPANTTAGTGYRVRIVSSSPVDTSANDGVNIHITTMAPSSFTNNLPVCPGDTIKLTASNPGTGVSYQWIDPNGTITTQSSRIIPNATYANAGQYDLTITSGACVVHDTLSAVIASVPNAPITASNSPVCSGANLGLSSASTTPGVTYSWKGPNGFTSSLQAPVVSNIPPADSGRYVVTVTGGGCSIKDSTYVVVTPSPVITALATNSVCIGDSINIGTIVTAGSALSWSGPNSYSNTTANVAIAHATATNAGSYILAASNNGCTAYDTINVSVNATPPKPTASSNSPICSGTTLSLTALNITGATYSWSGPNGYSAAVRNATRTVAVTDSGYYIVSAAVGNCASSDTTHVTINPGPVGVVFSGNSPVCKGDTLRVTASNQTSGATYSWTGPGGFTSAQSNFNFSNTPSLAATNSYYLTVTLGSCIVHDTLVVLANPKPAKPVITVNSPIVAGADSLCENIAASFTAIGTAGATYSWTGPAGFTSTSSTPTIHAIQLADSGYYTISSNLNGCIVADTQHITVLPAPLAVVALGNNTLCAGSTLTLNGNNATMGVTYNWVGPNSFSSAAQNISIPNITTAGTGRYVLTVAYNNACAVHDTVAVVVNALPARPTISSNSPLCSGNTLSFNPVTIAGATYSWTGPTGFTSAVRNATRPAVAVTDAGPYVVTATVNGCNSSDTAQVVINPSPAGIVYSSNSPVCAADTLRVTSSSQTTGVTYSWSGPGGFSNTAQSFSIPGITAGSAGIYILTVRYNSCTVNDTLTAVVKPLPALPAANSNSPVCIATPLNLSANSSTGGVSYNWTGPNGFTAATQNPIISLATTSDAGTYTVNATFNGCSSTSSTTTVTVNPAPAGTAISNSPVCEGSNLTFTANITPSALPYNWTGPNGFIASLQNPSITNTTVADDGVYNLSVSLGSCTTVLHVPVTITPLAGPPILAISVPLDTVCGGGSAVFTATATNAGSNPTYDWRIDGVSTGATGSTYNATTLHDGDLVTCVVTSNEACQPVTTAGSNAILMHIKEATIPPISIAVLPAVYNPGTKVTFTATARGSSACLTYQWRVNGVDLPGATSSSFETYTLQEGDKVSLFVHSSCSCTNPDTVLTNVISLAVNTIANSANYKVYPNPAQDELTIEGKGSNVQMELYDMSGKQVWVKPVQLNGGSAMVHLSLPAGVYTMKLTGENGDQFTDRLVIMSK